MQYTLALPKEGMDLVLMGLSELPYKVSEPVIAEALRQFMAQETAAGVPPAAPDAAAPAAQESVSGD